MKNRDGLIVMGDLLGWNWWRWSHCDGWPTLMEDGDGLIITGDLPGWNRWWSHDDEWPTWMEDGDSFNVISDLFRWNWWRWSHCDGWPTRWKMRWSHYNGWPSQMKLVIVSLWQVTYPEAIGDGLIAYSRLSAMISTCIVYQVWPCPQVWCLIHREEV